MIARHHVHPHAGSGEGGELLGNEEVVLSLPILCEITRNEKETDAQVANVPQR